MRQIEYIVLKDKSILGIAEQLNTLLERDDVVTIEETEFFKKGATALVKILKEYK